MLAVLLPSCVVTVTVADPAETPVTTPLLLTVATAVLLDAKLTDLSVASVGLTVAVNAVVAPTFTLAVAGVRDTPDTVTVLGLPLKPVLSPC